MKKITPEDLKNILVLLEDPDDKVFNLLEPQLLSQDEEFYHLLKDELTANTHPLVLKRISRIIEELYFRNIDSHFRRIPLQKDGDLDLEEATFLLATFQYPDLDIDRYKRQLDRMADFLAEKITPLAGPLFSDNPRLKKPIDPLTLIEMINDYLFKEEGFKGNEIDYMDPDNTYINMVMDRRTGIPITLSAIYLFITRRLSLPFYGIGMPGHFILKYKQDNFEVFIDPYYSGQILSKQDCVNFLLFSGYGFLERYLDVSSNKEILKRMIRNLLLIYKEENDDEKYDKLRGNFFH